VRFIPLVLFLLFAAIAPARADDAAGTVILIDTADHRLTVFTGGKPVARYPVAVGKPSTNTPVGEWRVLRKAMNWGTGFGTRWIGLDVPWGIYGIHGTNKPWSIGTQASAGCVRMNNAAVESVYPLVEPGTPVVVTGNPFGYGEYNHRVLRNGDVGGDVMQVQRVLRLKGLYHGPVHGIFDGGTERAVVALRRASRLSPDNCVDQDVYNRLGL
jgi:hypothetical protein